MGIYDTTADTYANSFNGPQNGAFNNPGWQMDPNLMTPSYAAPYRPQYDSYGPYQNTSNPGFFQSTGRLANPFYQSPMWQSPGQAAQPYFESAAYRPGDAFMTGMQRYAIPGLAAGAAMKYLGPNTGTIMGDIAGTFTGKGAASAFGRSMGRGLAGGAIRGFGLAGTGVAAGGAMTAAGVAGSAIAGFGLPLLAASTAASAADAVFIDPYVQQRTTSRDLRSNFSGVSFSGATGDVSRGGRGLSHRESGRIASDIVQAGIKDFALDTEDYTNISDMAGKSGMLDSTKHTDISKKIKSIAEQVKLVIQISQDPSVQNAMEELSKLQQGGASLTGGMFSAASGAYSEMGMHASAAGTTVKRLMDRVGAQGQMLYGMNGMTPYLGQVAAAKTYAGFATGQRTGLIGDAQLARMGGLGGATQSALTGSIAAMQTPYAKMLAFNQYGAGATGSAGMGPNQNTAAVLSAYGQSVGHDPLEAMGKMLVFGNQMTEKAFKEHGYKGIEDMAVSNLRDRGERPDSNGQYSVNKIAMGLHYMGMDNAGIQAFLTQRSSETSKEASEQRISGYRSQAKESTLTYLESEGLIDTVPSRIAHGAEVAWKGVKLAGESTVGLFNQSNDELADMQKGMWQRVRYGDSYSKVKGYSGADLATSKYNLSKYASSIDATLGNNALSTTDDLRTIGSVDALARKHAEKAMSESEMDDYIGSDPLLSKLVGGRKGAAALEVVTSVHNRARAGGYLNQGRIAASLGGVDGDGSKIVDRGLRNRFSKATTDSEKQDILLQEIVRQNGGTTQEDAIAPSSSMDLATSAKATSKAALAGRKIIEEVNSQASKAADYQKGFSDIIKKFDSPVGDFGNSVKSFDKIINQDLPKVLEKAGSDPGQITSSGSHWWQPKPDKTNSLAPKN